MKKELSELVKVILKGEKDDFKLNLIK